MKKVVISIAAKIINGSSRFIENLSFYCSSKGLDSFSISLNGYCRVLDILELDSVVKLNYEINVFSYFHVGDEELLSIRGHSCGYTSQMHKLFMLPMKTYTQLNQKGALYLIRHRCLWRVILPLN